MAFSKKIMLFTLVFLIYLSAVYAASFEASSAAIHNRIIIDELAKFRIDIRNNLKQSDEYRIYTLDFPTWDVRTEPIANPITLEVAPGSNGSIEIVVDPLKIKDIGSYQVNVNVKSALNGEAISVPLKVTILSTDALIQGYVPTVITGVEIAEKIDPREKIPIKISLNNQNIIDYPDLIIKLDSNLIKDAVNTQLGPKEDKTLDFEVSIGPLTPPQEDRLVVAVFKGNRSIINPIVRKIEVIEYADSALVSEEKKLFSSTSRYSFISNNKGYKGGEFKVETTLFSSIFSSTSPKARIAKENGKRYFSWDVELADSKMQVIVTKNYIPLFIAIALLIIVAVGYYILRSPLSMIKEANNIVKREGGVSEMNVILRLKNRSQNKIKEIEVSDYIPGIVSVSSDVPIGSLQPAKVMTHEKRGTTIVKWALDNLEPSEERILSYRIKSRLTILGSFSLPAARATFKSNDKLFTSASNRLSVNE